MAKSTAEKYSQISIQTISQIRGQEDFVEFLRTELEWPIPLHIDRLEDVSIPHDLQRDFGFSQAEDRIQVSRLLNLSEDQPWGIFLFEFKTRRPYLSHLRQLLRKLSSRRTLQRGDPIWDRNDLLFICTQDWKEYQFVHFSGERPESAVISSFGWKGPDDRFLHTLCKHNLPRLRMPDPAPDGNISADDWRSQWRDAFNIKPVTDEFYATLKEVFHAVESGITGLQGEDRRAFTELMINRLIFLKFVEKKSWLNNDRDYLFHHFQKFGGERYWKDFLYHLFFEGLNTDPAQRPAEASRVLGDVPYLNAELFSLSEQWNDSQVEVEGRSLDLLFDKLLNPYNFTVAETSPLEVEVAFNQDLLGYAYEELIADQHGQGAYYTHPTEVNLMCRESLRAFLEERCPQVEKEQIARLVYGELTVTDSGTALTPAHAVDLYTALHDVTICDPAIGSGTFPVAMVKHLFTSLRSLGQILKEYAPFRELIDQAALTDWRKGYELKLHIIERSIYGCDIDYFAVQIAKLRFWIELMVECNQPVPLPNFDFKLLVGDALVSAVGADNSGLPITLEEIWGHPTHPRGQVNISADLARKFAEKKKKYYGVEDPIERKKLLEELRTERKELIHQALQFSRTARELTNKHILWQIDFGEIFQGSKPGFDILIANPPYLRQELIDATFQEFGLLVNKKNIQDLYKKVDDINIGGQADLYVFFYERGLMLLKQKGGVHCYICSNSWLDADYGVKLQEQLLTQVHIRELIENRSKRSFENADINTFIGVFVTDSGKNVDKVTSFIALKKPFEKYSISELLSYVLFVGVVDDYITSDIRIKQIARDDLFQIGFDEIDQKYIGSKWGGIFLRAPDVYFQVINAPKNFLIPLKKLANIRRGITTGANDFFYLTPIREIDSEHALCKTESGEEFLLEREFLIPTIRNTRECEYFRVNKEICSLYLFMCNTEKRDLVGTHALKYIEWGEKQGFNKRPTCAPRARWWDLGNRSPWPIWWIIAHNDRDSAFLNDGVIPSDNFFEIQPLNEKYTAYIFIALISSWSYLQRELVGRTGFGGGLLKTQGPDLRQILLPNPRLIGIDDLQRIQDLLPNISEQRTLKIGNLEKTSERVIANEEILGVINKKELAKEVLESTVQLILDRLNKSKSV